MAVTLTPQSTALLISLEEGTTTSGSPKYKTLTFSNINTGATNQDVYDIGAALAGLQNKTLYQIERKDNGTLASA
ncbi:DUF1659 domain-containing protein [Heliophilum fasciatum]|uniref:Uncharacterized protein DUF1659 n=1 Tax=Heliophilum fasciatum TaxID=35700 RepID=A0A4V2SY56_9FIRM|nr:DUF1659 domain-containing protein [Heliophilum fasciatum]MCW2276894.1 hypothetical protein [Heliophilum fasciatum]TCP68646.1 uncharacterized protein DUF1659 [Heliophilum fasciatum]